MKRFNVWYKKGSVYVEGLDSPKTRKDIYDNYELVALVYGNDQEDVFTIMNGNGRGPNPLEHFLGQSYLNGYSEVRHTSMSVGDVAEDVATGKLYVARSAGWYEIN